MYISDNDLYDTVYQEKIYCAEGTHYYTPVLTELGWKNGDGKYLSLVRADPKYKSVDDWAKRYDITPSEFIDKLKNATLKKNRKTEEEKEQEIMDQRRHRHELQEALNEN